MRTAAASRMTPWEWLGSTWGHFPPLRPPMFLSPAAPLSVGGARKQTPLFWAVGKACPDAVMRDLGPGSGTRMSPCSPRTRPGRQGARSRDTWALIPGGPPLPPLAWAPHTCEEPRAAGQGRPSLPAPVPPVSRLSGLPQSLTPNRRSGVIRSVPETDPSCPSVGRGVCFWEQTPPDSGGAPGAPGPSAPSTGPTGPGTEPSGRVALCLKGRAGAWLYKLLS